LIPNKRIQRKEGFCESRRGELGKYKGFFGGRRSERDGQMGTTQVEKTEQELRKEIEELHRQQWEITERLRDPRGIRRGGLTGSGPRNFSASGPARQRGFVRPAERNESEDQPAPKRRLSSTVVKIEEGEIVEDAVDASKGDDSNKDSAMEVTGWGGNGENQNNRKPSNWARRDGIHRLSKMDSEVPPSENVPRVLPKDEDPSLVNRNRRMLGQLLGTLEKFRKEDVKLSGSEAFMRRSDSLKRAEQRAREESERLRQQEREQIAEKRRRDLTLRARVAAKAEEKKLELLFLRWSEHQKKLGNFLRTKAEPPIYYSFAKQLEEDSTVLEQRKEQGLNFEGKCWKEESRGKIGTCVDENRRKKVVGRRKVVGEEAFQEWKAARREELSKYQQQIGEQYVANVEKELERWQNGRKARNGNNDTLNLQETMDKELETHRLEHGPKTRKIPGGDNNEDEDDVEDMNVGEDDMMDDVLDVDDSGNRRAEETVKPDAAGNLSPPPANKD
ncbi:Pinin/SDK/MemA protein, partial [Cynara cardunculus var. scolymus]